MDFLRRGLKNAMVSRQQILSEGRRRLDSNSGRRAVDSPPMNIAKDALVRIRPGVIVAFGLLLVASACGGRAAWSGRVAVRARPPRIHQPGAVRYAHPAASGGRAVAADDRRRRRDRQHLHLDADLRSRRRRPSRRGRRPAPPSRTPLGPEPGAQEQDVRPGLRRTGEGHDHRHLARGADLRRPRSDGRLRDRPLGCVGAAGARAGGPGSRPRLDERQRSAAARRR